jgi:hypothetical protein
MRQSWNSLELITLEDETPCGISLGFDFCGEHETSHCYFKDELGVGHAANKGLHQYLAKPVKADDPRFVFYNRDKATKTIAAETRLIFHIDPEMSQELSRPKPRHMYSPAVLIKDGESSRPLAATWGTNGFCIRAFGNAEREMVQKLHTAALNGNLLVSHSGSTNPFSGSGLCLTILDMIPQSVHDTIAKEEENQERLKKAVTETGIEKTLKDAKLDWYALSPEWSNFFKTIGRLDAETGEKIAVRPATSHPVMFFLNPRKQSLYNYGWFTVEELQAWARNEGPVMKASAEKSIS